MSSPFIDQEFTFTNPDGSTIQVKGTGNQPYAVFEALDGYTVVKDPKDGFYKYASLSADKNDPIATDVKVNEVEPRDLGLVPHLRVRHESAKHKARTAPMRQATKSRREVRREEKKAIAVGIAADR